MLRFASVCSCYIIECSAHFVSNPSIYRLGAFSVCVLNRYKLLLRLMAQQLSKCRDSIQREIFCVRLVKCEGFKFLPA